MTSSISLLPVNAGPGFTLILLAGGRLPSDAAYEVSFFTINVGVVSRQSPLRGNAAIPFPMRESTFVCFERSKNIY
jgi:hypothetical protein